MERLISYTPRSSQAFYRATEKSRRWWGGESGICWGLTGWPGGTVGGEFTSPIFFLFSQTLKSLGKFFQPNSITIYLHPLIRQQIQRVSLFYMDANTSAGLWCYLCEWEQKSFWTTFLGRTVDLGQDDWSILSIYHSFAFWRFNFLKIWIWFSFTNPLFEFP